MILFHLNGTETDKLNNKQYLLFCNKAIQVQGWTAFSCLAHIKCNWLYLHQLFKIHCIVVAGKEQYLPNLGQTTSHKERKFQLINWHTKLMSFKFDSLCYLSFSFHVPNLPNKQPLTLITKMACHPQIPCNTKNKIKTLSKKNSSL